MDLVRKAVFLVLQSSVRFQHHYRIFLERNTTLKIKRDTITQYRYSMGVYLEQSLSAVDLVGFVYKPPGGAGSDISPPPRGLINETC